MAYRLHQPGLLQKLFGKWRLKALLGMLAFGMVTGVLLYTNMLVNELVQRELNTVQFYAGIYDYYLKKPNSDPESFLHSIYSVTKTISFPLILTDEKNTPNLPLSEYSLNVVIDTTLSEEQQMQKMREIVSEMSKVYKPIDIKDQNGVVIQRIFYTNSDLIRKLQLLPYVEIIIVGAFVIIGYVAFSYVRRNEESNIWVGMAKEAAHQLGTPLSSILAWIEIMRINADDPASVEETLKEMEHDVERLNTIANRFSKIGNDPEKHHEDIGSIIEGVCMYFERRVPHLGKKVTLQRQIPSGIIVSVNRELFEWVIENLLKNAVQAIETKHGEITINLKLGSRGKVIITVSDNGKGMTKQIKRQIFDPGFTTKKRGWGLGLSLSKRIIEQYHNGKIYVKETTPGKGTTFSIELKRAI